MFSVAYLQQWCHHVITGPLKRGFGSSFDMNLNKVSKKQSTDGGYEQSWRVCDVNENLEYQMEMWKVKRQLVLCIV